MLSLNTFVPRSRPGPDGTDYELMRRGEAIMNEAGFCLILALTPNDCRDVREDLTNDQAWEVLEKMSRKWEIDWSSAVADYAYMMYPEKNAEFLEE